MKEYLNCIHGLGTLFFVAIGWCWSVGEWINRKQEGYPQYDVKVALVKCLCDSFFPKA